MFNSLYTAVFFLVGPILAIIWSAIFIPFGVFNIKLYKITGRKMQVFCKKVRISSIRTNDEVDGWICGKWYIGYITRTAGKRDAAASAELMIVCTAGFYKTHFDFVDIDSEDKMPKTCKYCERETCFYQPTYTGRMIELPKKTATKMQKSAVARILEIFKKKLYAIVLLYGNAGAGKSMTAQFVCAELLKTCEGVTFVDTFNPSDPGDSFSGLYNQILPTAKNPLVILFEEVDILISAMHDGKITQGANSPIQIKNKSDWNSFLDKFDRELYPHVIFIMTTNKTDSFFDVLDPSYMRKGRVDVKIPFHSA